MGTEDSQHAWWQGKRGEWYVAGQILLIALVFLGPRQWKGFPSWPFIEFKLALIFGIPILILGMVVFIAALFRLGSNLTPLPHPKQSSSLIVSGPYRLVRHPIYSGGILISFGWAIILQSWLTLSYALILFVFFDIKSRREERWLVKTFPSYPEYQRRVKKFIPFIY